MRETLLCLGCAARAGSVLLAVLAAALYAQPASCQQTPEVLVSQAFEDGVLSPSQKVQVAKVRLGGTWQMHLTPASHSETPGARADIVWVSGAEVDWSLTWTAANPGDPENHDGTFQFTVADQSLGRLSNKAFDTIFLRVAQVDPGMTVVIPAGVDVVAASAVPEDLDDPLQANGQVPLALRILTGAPFVNGFSITGKLTPSFLDATVPVSQLDEPFFEIIVANTGCGREDLDCDSVPNPDDNCPTVGNADQFDGDEDGVGFVCDNCRADCIPREGFTCANSDQDDRDHDGVGFVCDNCPGGPPEEGGCIPRRGFTCHNPPQSDEDVDEFGNRDGFGFSCDNCPFDFNPSQAPFPGARRGNACLPFGLQFVTNAPPTTPPGGVEGLLGGGGLASTTSSLTGGVSVDPTNETPLRFECGANNVSIVNIGVRHPPGVTAVSFAGCDPPTGVEQIGFCGSSTLDPFFFNRDASFVRGPNIGGADVLPDPGVASNFVLIHLVGAQDPAPTGFSDPVICFDGDPALDVGTLSISGPSLSPDSVIAVSTEDFAGFNPEVEMLFDADGEKIEIENVVAATGPTPGTERLLIEVGPDPSDVSGNRRMQLTLASPSPLDVVRKLAIGVRSFSGILPSQLGFGGCSGTPVPLLNGVGETINVVPCAADPDLSAGVQPTDVTSLNTYIVPPNDPSLPIDPLDPTAPLADTLYMVVTGQYIGGAPQASLNYPGQTNKTGAFQFTLPDTAPPPALPILTFDGVLRLPGVTAPIVSASTGPISPTQVLILSAAERPEDLDHDGHDDDSDNCVNFANDQIDTGGLLFIGIPDGTGNDCQCGDGSEANDGAVQAGDVTECTDALAGAPVSAETLARCSVTGDVGVDIGDLVALQLRISGDTSATISQACQQAVGTP